MSVMKTSARKPFQEATVEHVLGRLRDRRGSRRFLVADEVGLGKTLVAQGVIEGLCRRKREPLRVFYMCSSLAIAAQNKRRLLEIIADDAQRELADVHADRLDLLPSVEISGEPPFFLYSLTPHTTAGDGTGRVDERVVIGKALQEISATLGRKRAFLETLRQPAGEKTWEARWAEIEIQDRGVLKHFRDRVCEEIGRRPGAWEQTIAEEVERRLEEETRATVEALRRAMTLAVLDALCPDVVILDEFQRFFEMLPPPQRDDDEDEESDGEGSRTAHEVMRAVLGAQRPRNERPAVLMLSATPYRLFARTREGQQHHTEFFLLMSFLYDDDREDKALRDLFARYRDHLMRDEPGSTAVFGVKSEIEERLLRVMCRTERSRLAGDRLPAPISARREIRLEADDVRVYRHLDDSAEGVEFGVEPYWSSIPFPLQAMDQRYALRARAKVAPLRAGERHLRLDFRVIQRYGAQRYPHPRLRGLLEQLPGDVLCLPWLPPSRAWWPLGGPFARMPAGACSKALVFSRFRAIPRILSAVLSYEAERAAFGEETARRQPYDYFARTRAGAQREDITGQAPRRRLGRGRLALKRQPAPSFGLSARGRHGENRRTLLLFLPAPALAALADPLTFDRSGVEALTCERAVALVRARLRDMLGEASDAEPRPRGRLWRWVATLEGRARSAEAFRDALEGWAQAVAKAHPGAAQTCRELRDEMARPLAPGEHPTDAELDELAELALLGPGNVLLRAVRRVFGEALDPEERWARLLDVSLLSLRTYLDAPEWHRFLRARDERRSRGGHAERVRRAVWDGNLEAVLDEYLAVLQGLGTTQPDAAREAGALEDLERALSLRDARVAIHRLSRGGEPRRMRCHAAVPLGLSPADVEDASGAFRGDTLRIAFNSPFRPMALVTTSIGQEGLDFHLYCRNVIHWDLPSNAIDLEQRDGRIMRYGSLAVRQSLKERLVELPSDRSPWHSLAARVSREESGGGLEPWWSVPDAAIFRTVFVPSFSAQVEQLADLEADLAFYRLTLGQSNQEHLVRVLERRIHTVGEGVAKREMRAWLQEAAVNLCPFDRGASPGRPSRGTPR
ncbi:helicase-related protein [Sorangium sp. So ce291]|uniref:helicase-related protein n=1 Tax=Sorangium sp. So ce291 TaxID=3133294 RepID=UPI003F5E268A